MFSKKTPRMLHEEARQGRPLEEIIPETINRLGSIDAASKALGITTSTLYTWIYRLGITIKLHAVLDESKGV